MATLTAQPTTNVPPQEIRRRVRQLALPAVGEQLLNTAVGLADVYLVGNMSVAVAAALGYSSATALTAAGLANQFVWLMTVLLMALGVGTTALVARAVGAREESQIQRIVLQSVWLASGLGLFAMVVMQLGAESFLRLLNTPAEVLPIAADYIHISGWSMLPTAILFVGGAALRGAGDTRSPLYVMLGVNLINIVVSWLLINGNLGLPMMGVQGASMGSAIARTCGGGVALWLLLSGRLRVRLVPSLTPDFDMLRRIVRIGLPSAGEQLIFQGALLIFVRFLTELGTVAYAAHNVTLNIESISFLPGMGYAAATSALVGQALGARNQRLAVEYAHEALWQGGLMMTGLGALMVIFPEPLLMIFVQDPAVIAAATPVLRFAGMVQPALAMSFILLGALRGAGDTRWPMVSRIITTWVVRLPLIVLLVGVWDLGLAGIWLGMCTDFTVQAMLAALRFRQGAWQKIEV